MTATKIKVIYWAGTSQREEWATTYTQAMRIAAKNQNARDAQFFAEDGERLLDCNGIGLVRESKAGDSTLTLEV